MAAIIPSSVSAADAEPEFVYRPLVEEYTGLWCTGCPAGYVAIEECSEKYGSDFVAIAYHVNDEIQSAAVTLPTSPKSVPAAYGNRQEIRGGVSSIGEFYTEEIEQGSAGASLTVRLEWTSRMRSQLRAVADVKFAENHSSADYRLAYCLVADGLKNRAWLQANRFSGMNYSGKYWDLFTKGGAYVANLEYNNVPCIFNDVKGIEGSLPKEIKAMENYTHSESFVLSKAKTRKTNAPLIQDNDRLRVIVILFDVRNGRVVNCVSSEYSKDAPIAMSGVQDVEQNFNGSAVEVRYYSMQGVELNAAPRRGTPYIRVEIIADGERRVSKML